MDSDEKLILKELVNLMRLHNQLQRKTAKLNHFCQQYVECSIYLQVYEWKMM